MNHKGAVGPVGALFGFLVFLVIWFVWLGGFISQAGQIAIQSANLTGVEAFFMANLNFVIFICLLLGMMAWAYVGGGQ